MNLFYMKEQIERIFSFTPLHLQLSSAELIIKLMTKFIHDVRDCNYMFVSLLKMYQLNWIFCIRHTFFAHFSCPFDTENKF